MTSVGRQPLIANAAGRWRAATLADRPVAVFVLLSILFGLPAVFLIPPLRGADEPAHFLRAYGITQGRVIPSLADAQGRKGIFLPARLNDGFQFFEAIRYRFGTEGFNYRDAFAEYLQRERGRDHEPVFVLYAGSEGYSPVAYVPYVAAVMVGRAFRLDFVPMLWLMRLAGFIAATAVVAYAISIVPHVKWPFLFIATLPIAVFERAFVSADGAALALTMMVTALCLRAATRGGDPPLQRSLWMTLCLLVKPSHTPFVVLEAMTAPFKDLFRRWHAVALVVAPGLILTPLWLFAVSADMAAWRMIEGTGAPPEHFNVGWKLAFLIEHPQHFLTASLASLANLYELWREMMGGLGWRDTHLPVWLYVVLSVIFLATCLVRLELDFHARMRTACVAALAVLGYWLAVFLIFYLAWTPIDAPWIHGIQGRYFTIVLPIVALVIAALANRAPPQPITAAIAAAGAMISGVSMLDAIVRSQW